MIKNNIGYNIFFYRNIRLNKKFCFSGIYDLTRLKISLLDPLKIKVLRSLLLNNNLLTSLKNGIFTGLVQLRHLYLYKNRIKYIESEVFQGLPKLEHL
jgi:Leucine-rich repeat (LRR) protein